MSRKAAAIAAELVELAKRPPRTRRTPPPITAQKRRPVERQRGPWTWEMGPEAPAAPTEQPPKPSEP